MATKRGLTDGELAQITNAIHDAVAPLAAAIQKHDQTLYGVNGDNGVTGDLKYISSEVSGLDKFRTKIVAVTAATQIVIGATAFWIDKWLNHGGK